jgi:hypothetical protein
MNSIRRRRARGEFGARARVAGAVASVLVLAWGVARGQEARGLPPGDGHVPELARYLEQVEIYAPVVYRHLAVFPVRSRGGEELRGRWLTLDQGLAQGTVIVSEKGGHGTVPMVVVTNRSRDDYVLILAGELLAGGKQTRIVRQDIILAPGQSTDLNVFCVEAHRWEGAADFKSAKVLAPASLQQELRRGAEQSRIWAEVARNNAALGAENRTGSLEVAMNADLVRGRLVEIRERLLPQVPGDTIGIIIVDRDRAVGAEFLGRHALAMALLPKLLDAYIVDVILKRHEESAGLPDRQQEAAIDFFRRIRQAGSQRVATPGSGTGIRTRGGGLLGDGVSLDSTLVHYGVQTQDRIVPLPPRPIIPGPEPRIRD